MKKTIVLILVGFLIISCSKNDDNSNGGTGGGCIAGEMKITETKAQDFPDGNKIFFDYDVKNNSKTDYTFGKTLGTFINYRIKVTTTDGTVYDGNGPFLLSDLKSGATTTAQISLTYGAGKTYKSNVIELYCE
jgi:hypothetical protein